MTYAADEYFSDFKITTRIPSDGEIGSKETENDVIITSYQRLYD